MKKKGGWIKDMISDEQAKLSWVGHWSISRGSQGDITGASIPIAKIPKIKLEINRPYHITFQSLDDRYPPHEVDLIGILVGTDYIDDFDKKKQHHFLRFQKISNFEALLLIKKSKIKWWRE